MLTSAPMRFFCAVILVQDMDRVTDFFLRRDSLHLVRIGDMEPWGKSLGSTQTEELVGRYQEIERRLAALLPAGKLPCAVLKNKMPDVSRIDVEVLGRKLTVIEARRALYFKKKDSLLGQLKENELLQQHVNRFGTGAVGRAACGGHPFLTSVLAKADESQRIIVEQGLATILHASCPFIAEDGTALVLVLALKQDDAAVQAALAQAKLIPIAPNSIPKGDPEYLCENIRFNILKANKEIERLDVAQARHATRLLPVLRRLYQQIIVARLMAEAQGYFQRTARTCLVCGWLPEQICAATATGFKDMLKGCCCVHIEHPRQMTAVADNNEQVPVLLDNPPWLKPFEMIVTNYDTPEYGTIDPTLFVAVSFCVMFGAMSGDVGQGLLLVLAGLLLGHHRQTAAARAGALMAYAGVAAAIFGLLYGVVFGMEGVIPALWMRPMENVAAFFPMAIIFGAGLISLGVVINIINAFRSGDILKRLFGTRGSLLESGVELLVLGIGYLANTLSYIRLSAFALAHAGLFLAVFSLADMAGHAAGSKAGMILIMVIGNIFILLFEGLMAAIQGVRLEYYEFFSKFFIGGGKVYRPLGYGRVI